MVVVVISFLSVLGTNGRLQPVVMAPKNLSTKHYGLNKIKKRTTQPKRTLERNRKRPEGNMTYTRTKKAVDAEAPNPGEAVYGGEMAGEVGEPLDSRGLKPGGRE